MSKLLRRVLPVLPLALCAVALRILYGELPPGSYRRALAAVEAVPAEAVAAAGLCTLAFYVVLAGRDWLGSRFAGLVLPLRDVALASFLGSAFEQTVGTTFLTSKPLRSRLYAAWGATVEQVTKLVGFGWVTAWVGLFGVGGVALTSGGSEIVFEPGSVGLGRGLGIGLLVCVGGYVLASRQGRPELRLQSWSVGVPPLGTALGQVVIGAGEWVAAGSALYVLLPRDAGVPWPGVLAAFAVARAVGTASQVPGGLGVFETVVVLLLEGEVPVAALLGGLLLYRVVFHLLPVIAATVVLAGIELYRERSRVERVIGAVTGLAAAVVPQAMALTTFLGGAILLFTGATPARASRLSWLNEILPLPVIEASHFLASVAGALLLVLARGLQRRLDLAYQATLGLLGGGIVFSLLRGLDWVTAAALAVMFVVLAPLHEAFDRRADFAEARFTPGWIAAIVLVLASTTWLTLFAYRHVELSHELWWSFALRGDAPRSARALVAVAAVLLVVGIVRLARPAPPEPEVPEPEEIDRAAAIAAESPRAYAFLALTGDKRLLFGEEGASFLMYAVEGRSWVSLGDPVGPEDAARGLAWRFREMAERHDDWPVFYQVADDRLHHYVDMGLSLLKIGEEGRVPLSGFSLEGGARKEMRQVLRRTEEREGGRFELLPRERVPELAPRLREISDAWLRDKSAAEKGFSLGWFDATYLARFPLATVWVGERLVAFANVFATGPKVDLSLDLMRYVEAECPPGIMTYLFVRLMTWGAEQGYERFSLGMAPLAGLEELPKGPLWNRVGSLVYRHGEHFYNFEGLRAYKDKFDPVWEPRYLACPGGLALPQVLTNLTTLISGGVAGVFRR